VSDIVRGLARTSASCHLRRSGQAPTEDSRGPYGCGLRVRNSPTAKRNFRAISERTSDSRSASPKRIAAGLVNSKFASPSSLLDGYIVSASTQLNATDEAQVVRRVETCATVRRHRRR